MVMPLEVFFYQLEVATKITSAAFMMLFAVYFWNHRRTADLKSTRRVLLGQGLFVFCYAITRLFFIAANYFSGEIASTVHPDAVLYVDDFLFSILWKAGTGIGILAIIFLLIVIETYLVKSRYVFSIISATGLIIALASPDINFSRWATYITQPLALLGVIILYFYLFFKGSGEIRKRAGLSILGLLIFGGGVLIDITAARLTFIAWFGFHPGFIPPLLMIAGLALYTYYNIKA